MFNSEILLYTSDVPNIRGTQIDTLVRQLASRAGEGEGAVTNVMWKNIRRTNVRSIKFDAIMIGFENDAHRPVSG